MCVSVCVWIKSGAVFKEIRSVGFISSGLFFWVCLFLGRLLSPFQNRSYLGSYCCRPREKERRRRRGSSRRKWSAKYLAIARSFLIDLLSSLSGRLGHRFPPSYCFYSHTSLLLNGGIIINLRPNRHTHTHQQPAVRRQEIRPVFHSIERIQPPRF